VIDNRCYLCFAVDTHHGIRGGIAVTDDLDKWEVLSLSVPDNRNMVLFPGGMILEDSGEVKIYYGASDTVECLATAQVDDLIAPRTAVLSLP